MTIFLHVYCSFAYLLIEISTQILCWLFYLGYLSFYYWVSRVFIWPGHSFLIRYTIANYLTHSLRCFSLCWCCHLRNKVVDFGEVQNFLFLSFAACAYGDTYKKTFLIQVHREILLYILLNLIVLALMILILLYFCLSGNMTTYSLRKLYK